MPEPPEAHERGPPVDHRAIGLHDDEADLQHVVLLRPQTRRLDIDDGKPRQSHTSDDRPPLSQSFDVA
jgi:hypothetical protein